MLLWDLAKVIVQWWQAWIAGPLYRLGEAFMIEPLHDVWTRCVVRIEVFPAVVRASFYVVYDTVDLSILTARTQISSFWFIATRKRLFHAGTWCEIHPMIFPTQSWCNFLTGSSSTTGPAQKFPLKSRKASHNSFSSFMTFSVPPKHICSSESPSPKQLNSIQARIYMLEFDLWLCLDKSIDCHVPQLNSEHNYPRQHLICVECCKAVKLPTVCVNGNLGTQQDMWNQSIPTYHPGSTPSPILWQYSNATSRFVCVLAPEHVCKPSLLTGTYCKPQTTKRVQCLHLACLALEQNYNKAVVYL